ncbi:UDP-N-acetylmuramoyl-L-alanine--D-glutamate ligase [Isobaculum melis]|uniref:UDP-N-acetylmuramoylalanine--D-glutamate ligase n=1 Tax=Isobaculum melis TaxID=142588 RepID=A0A1H9T6N9_9LACT|nr:UDP-N-acetylmuramoyl-L-alanine--D-glutamate ligase [Isobaculum melis]SER92920.1 UDP-N-acetylmuramoylalanine--D-glutamate ligase [Isobaculum melis]
MKEITAYTNKKVLVLGLAKSGVNAAKLLHHLGAFVTVNDFKGFDENPEAQELLESGIKVVTGGHPVELLDEDFELLVKNPGIMYNNPMVERAIERNIPIVTEVELAYQVAESTIVGITGTNGKTTTTTMVAEILNENSTDKKAYVAGNIGTPASIVAQAATANDVIVMELSSFQLMGIQTFRPKIGVITNLYEAHIDYHGTREEYVAAKWRLTENQTSEDYLVLNWDQQELRELSQTAKAQIIPFSRTQKLEKGAYCLNNHIYYDGDFIMDASDILLPGTHNLENALAAIGVCRLLGQSIENIQAVLKRFSGVKHRTQFVKEWNGRKFYNDSKATNTLATKNALKGFSEPVVLLAGGLDRGNDFDDLIPSMKQVKAAVLFGETAGKMAAMAKQAGVEQVKVVQNVEAAVPVAYDLSAAGDVILLSPACASWDQYRSFEVRGDLFIEAVNHLAEN